MTASQSFQIQRPCLQWPAIFKIKHYLEIIPVPGSCGVSTGISSSDKTIMTFLQSTIIGLHCYYSKGLCEYTKLLEAKAKHRLTPYNY